MKHKILLSEDKFWSKFIFNNKTLWIKGYCNYSNQDLSKALNSLKKDELKNYISSITGHFAIVFSSLKRTLIIVDRIRSNEINILQDNNSIFISSDFNKLKNKFNSNEYLNEQAKLELSMGGFTIGNNTLFSNIISPNAGQYILIENNNIEVLVYFNYFGKIDFKSTEDQLISELTEVTLDIFKKIQKKVGKRQVVIPLSAGNDSRLVASIFKHLRVKNVLCFSYGNKNSFEVQTAKKIANQLGYNWTFVPLSHTTERKFYKSKIYLDYLKYSTSVNSVSNFQGLSSIYYLKRNNLLQDDAIFINGNSGDFISGLHINKLHETITSKSFKYKNLSRILKEEYIYKHYSLWGDLKNKENIKMINKSIDKELGQLENIQIENAHLAFEKLELVDRQSKYVIFGQKTFEFFGYDWMLPLWDDKYLFFWKKVSSNFKYKQVLYNKMLILNDWGGVWKSIPINKKTTGGFLLRSVRLFFKIIFVFFGKQKWHQFETTFIKYWSDPIYYHKFQSYFKIIKEYKRKPKNAVSWVTKNYLEKLLE